jgi:chromosome segregation ATPase
MDIDISPEPLSLDAQYAELQLRYTTLQQEYQSFKIQHETLVSKSNTQHENIVHLENENAEMKGFLEKYTTEHQRLNHAYYRVMQEHEACQKAKEQLEDLAHRWKAQSKENMELNSTLTQLRYELKKALENRTPDKPPLREEEVQAPVAIEATTMSDMEFSDDEPISDDLISVVTIEQAATQAPKEGSTRQGKRKRGEVTREIAIKRYRMAGLK